MDREQVEDAIRHFAGALDLLDEGDRARPSFDRFAAPAAPDPLLDPLSARSVDLSAPFALDDVDPGLDYAPRWDPIADLPTEQRDLAAPPGPVAEPLLPVADDPFPFAASSPAFSASMPAAASATFAPPPPPGSVAVVGRQSNVIEDLDIVVGSAGLDGETHSAWIARGEAAASAIERLDASVAAILGEVAPPASEQALIDMVTAATDTLAAFADPVARGEAAWAVHADGERVDELPDRPSADGADDGESGINTGGNEATNQAVIFDAWVDAPTYIVGGDYTSLDLISQTNIARDVDVMDLPGTLATGGFTQDDATNAARLTAVSNPVAQPGTSDMPANWIVTRLETNLVSATWLEQVNVIVDGDLVASVEQSTRLETGSNQALDIAVLQTLGRFFDVIVVGGDMVHANIVVQRNVLLDDDLFTGGTVTAALGQTGGNTAWNEAAITIVGTVTLEGLGNGQQAALNDLADGASPTAVGTGGPLNVLYVDGDFIDVTYVAQTNIVSDADTVIGVDLHPMLAGDTIDTGSNALVNDAIIVDYGIDSTVHVAGEIYSDALIHQAELIDGGMSSGSAPDATAMAPLVSEAVLFLTDDDAVPAQEEGHQAIVAIRETGSETVDIMQAMTG